MAAMFTVGNLLLRYPWREADEGLFSALLLSVTGAIASATLMTLFFARMFRRLFGGGRRRVLPLVLLTVILSAYAISTAAEACNDWLRLCMELILPGERRWPIAFFLMLCVLAASRLSGRGLRAFALLISAVVISLSVFLFFLGLSVFQLERLPEIRFSIDGLSALPSLLLELALPMSALAAWCAAEPNGGTCRGVAIGALVGGGLLILSVSQALLTLGVSYAAELPYPYTFSVRILSVGQYFFRMEGAFYLCSFLTCAFRAAVCLSLVKRLVDATLPRWRSAASAVSALLLLILCLR